MRGLFVYGRAFSMNAAAAFTEGDAQISSDSARRHHCNAFHGGQRCEFGLPLRQGCDPERHKKHCPHEQTVQHPLFSVQCCKTSPAGSIANETATVERGKSRCGGISTLQQTAATSPNRMNADARPLTIPARACAARRGAPRSALILRFCIKQHPHVPIKRYAWRCLFIPDLFAGAAVRRGRWRGSTPI